MRAPVSPTRQARQPFRSPLRTDGDEGAYCRIRERAMATLKLCGAAPGRDHGPARRIPTDQAGGNSMETDVPAREMSSDTRTMTIEAFADTIIPGEKRYPRDSA